MFPQIQLVQSNLLDVAETWGFGTSVISNTLNEFNAVERFRPLYALERTILNVLFLYNSTWYFLTFAILLAITAFLLCAIGRYQKLPWTFCCIALVLLFISPVTIDTYWRLGTAENLFTLLLLLGFYDMVRGEYTRSALWIFLLMGAKETAIFYIPVFLLYLYIYKRWKEFSVLLFGYSVFVIKIVSLMQYTYVHPEVYTSLVSKSMVSIVDMVMYMLVSNSFYVIMFWMSCMLYVYRLMKHGFLKNTSRGDVGFLYFGLSVAGICSIVSFHNKFQPYYAFPWIVITVLWCMWELHKVSRHIRTGVLIMTGVWFLILGIPSQTLQRAQFWQNDYVADGMLIQRIEKDRNARIYQFGRLYRPELKPALDILYAKYGTPEGDAKSNSIWRIDDIQATDGEKVCGITFFGEQSCKWSIEPSNK